MVDSVSVRFKNARVEKLPLNIRIQWNAGTACVSECVLKTLACWGSRVGPSKSASLLLPICVNLHDLLCVFKKTLRPFSAELPKSDSDTCLGRFDSDFEDPSGCNSDFRAVTLTFAL